MSLAFVSDDRKLIVATADAQVQTEGSRKPAVDILGDRAELKAAKSKAEQLEAIHSKAKALAQERKDLEAEGLALYRAKQLAERDARDEAVKR